MHFCKAPTVKTLVIKRLLCYNSKTEIYEVGGVYAFRDPRDTDPHR
jgi:hypothetical protein